MSRDDILNVLIENMRTIIVGLPEREVRETDSLVNDFGADSLQVVEIVSRTMRSAKAKVKRTELNRAKNIGELVDMLCAGSVSEPKALA